MNESKHIGDQIRFSNGNKTISIYKKKEFFSLLTPYLNVGFAVWPMTVRMSEVWREKVSLDSRRVYCRRSSNRVCFLHVTVGCGVGYGHFWWTFLRKQEWVVKIGSSCLFSEEVEIPIRQSWGKIITSENPKCVGLQGKVCAKPSSTLQHAHHFRGNSQLNVVQVNIQIPQTGPLLCQLMQRWYFLLQFESQNFFGCLQYKSPLPN